jgi:hypothetical protein
VWWESEVYLLASFFRLTFLPEPKRLGCFGKRGNIELHSCSSPRDLRPVRLAPPASGTFLSEQTSHQQPVSNTFLSEQTSTSHQPNEHAAGSEVPHLNWAVLVSKKVFKLMLNTN